MILSDKKLLEFFQKHCLGRKNIRTAKEVLLRLTGTWNPSLERTLRERLTLLRKMGYPIVTTFDCRGYYYADDPNDLVAYLSLLRTRAFTSLTIAARMLRLAMPDIQGQLRLPVGSEPTKPFGGISYHDEGTISCEVFVPTDLYEEVRVFLGSNKDWDFNEVIENALALFLLQNGRHNRVLADAYLHKIKE